MATPQESSTTSTTTVQSSTRAEATDVRYHITRDMEEEFSYIRGMFGRTFHKVERTLSNHNVPVDDVKSFCKFTYPKCSQEISDCQTMEDVMTFVANKCTLINISILEELVDDCEIDEAKQHIQDYQQAIDDFSQKMRARFPLNQSLLPDGTPHPLCGETITFVMKWEPETVSLDDIEDLQTYAFGELYDKVQVIVTSYGNGAGGTFSINKEEKEHSTEQAIDDSSQKMIDRQLQLQLLVDEHIKKQGKLKVTTTKAILYGPPRVGKTSLMKRLIGEEPPVFSPSTGIDTPVTVPIYKESEFNSFLIDLEWKRLSPEEMLQTCLDFISTSLVNSTNERSSESAALGQHSQQASTEDNLQEKRADEIFEVEEIQSQGSDTISGRIPSQIMDFIKNQDWKKVSQELKGVENLTLLQIIDVGGQPEFHDILPLLLTGPALYLLFFNLTQHLETSYSYEYQYKDRSFSTTYTSYLTTLQILHQILSSIALSSHDDDDSAAIIIGTFLDKLRDECIADGRDLQKEIKKVDDNLKSYMEGHAYYNEGILKQCPMHDRPNMFFPVDNVSGTMDDEIQPLRDFVKRILNNLKLKGSPLPTTWALFYYLLQDFPKQNNGREYCTLDEARELAKGLQINDDDFENALKYIHNKFGSVLYYDDVCDDKGVNYVFCNPNLILKLVNKLVAVCFGSNLDHKQLVGRLRKIGIITVKEFYKLCESFSDDISDPMLPYVIKLLERRHIISNINNTHYFIPCLLEAPINTKYIPNPSEEVAPLLLRFSKDKETVIPPGLFSCMIVRLSMMEGWNLDGSERYKNKVNFLCEKSAVTVSVAVIAQPHWIEVQLLDAKQSSPALSIWNDIHDVINEISDDDTLLAKVLKSVDVEVGFYCPKAKTDDIPHYAKKANDEKMLCSSCEKNRSKPYDLEKKHKIWFNDQYHNHELTTTSSQTSQSTTNNKMSSSDIFQSHFALLTQAITPILNPVSVGLFAQKLIPQTTVNEMQTVGLTDDYKSSKLMTVLMAQLNASFNPDNYLINIRNVFINQNHQPLTDIANNILHQLGCPVQCQGASNHQSESTAEMTSPELPRVVKPSRKRTHSCRNREDNNSSDEESDNEHQPADKRPRVSTTPTQVDQSYMETD